MTQAKTNLRWRFTRVNPFRGLLIDEQTWADAHEYHRNQMRFHLLELHGMGIASGLEVVAAQPPAMNVTVRPGLAVDPAGHLLFLGEPQTVRVDAPAEPTTFFIMLEYTEEPVKMQTITEGGSPQVSRLLEDCEVRVSPEKSYSGVELARVIVDPNNRQIRNPTNPRQPAQNEIDLNGRRVITGPGGGVQTGRQALTVGVVRYGPRENNEWKRHAEGIRRLLRDTTANTNVDANLMDGVNLLDRSALDNCRVLYMTGRAAFKLTTDEEQALQRFLERGGVMWVEPCRHGLPTGKPDDFSRSCLELIPRLNRQLGQPLRAGHPLLNGRYLFAAVPPALDASNTLYEARRLIIAPGDYGCLWEGRGQEGNEPPSREVLRSAQELGTNALFLTVNQG